MSSIITVPQLKQVNPAVNDEVGAAVVAAVNAWIENVTSRCWGEEKTATERHDASSVVWLRHMDVREVEYVRTGYPGDTATTLEANRYYCSAEGRLRLKSGGRRPIEDYLEVKYTYGTEAVPDDLVLAALGIATSYYDWATNGGREISRAQVGSYTLQFANSSSGFGGQPDPTVSRDMQVVKSYALRRI
ncbi:hypothetical protein G6024_14725 [Dietzia maris]|nr:hypothetical protein [Dietzia maris]MBB0998325.1 hypothetical protein [Dietzia maris]